MRKVKSIVIAAAVLAGIAVTANLVVEQISAQQQPLRIAYVNSTVIMQQFEDAQRVNRQLEALATNWDNELRRMIEELQEKYEDYQRKQAMMTEPARIEAQQELFELEQEINQFQRDKFQQPGGEFFVEQERLFRPVREKIMSAIDVIANEERLDFVLDRTEEVPVVLFAQRRHDITFKVLDHLKRGTE